MSFTKPAVSFAHASPLRHAINTRVAAYFEERGLSRRDAPRMYVKTAIILGWAALSYALLVFWGPGVLLSLLFAVSLGLALAGIGMNIQHDGNHGAYSRHRWINRLAGFTIDVVGTSSYRWHWKHNRLHHTYTNIEGLDSDIGLWPLGRIAPEQPRLWFHRFQHIYLWFFYGFLPFKMNFFDDIVHLVKGEISGVKVPRPRGWELFLTILGKAMYLTLFVIIPIALWGVLKVALFFFVTFYVLGFVLSVVFQVAHCLGEAGFRTMSPAGLVIDKEWSAYQVETSVDFAPRNRFLTWYLGGLNFQAVHHLYPTICHVHYPALQPLIQEACQEQGVSYRVLPSFRRGILSHFRWLRRLGRGE